MTHLVAIVSFQPISHYQLYNMEARKSMRRPSTSNMKAKGQFPSDKETLQDSVELIFGSDINQMKEMASKMRTRFFQAAIAGAVGSIIFYYLLLNHHI